jgi:hypothetical protein
VDTLAEQIQKAKEKRQLNDQTWKSESMDKAVEEFQEHFDLKPDKVEFIKDLGVVIQSGETRLVWYRKDSWALTDICEMCGKEFANDYGVEDIEHLKPPKIHTHCSKKPVEKYCPLQKEECHQSDCALWNIRVSNCAITVISMAADIAEHVYER